jgi:FkbM family methyltransferase
MEKIHRDGIDIDVALAAAARRTAPPAARSDEPDTGADTEAGGGSALPVPPPAPVPRTGIRRWMRRLAGGAFRLFKPILRPIAFRARRYLTDTLHHDVQNLHALSQQEMRRASTDFLRELQSARELLRREIVATQAEPTHSQMLSTLLLELQAGRDLLRRELLAGQRRSMLELEHSLAALRDDSAALALAGREQMRREAERIAVLHEDTAAALARAESGIRALQEAGAGAQALQEAMMPRLDRIEQYCYAGARRVAINCGGGDLLVRTEAGYMMCSGGDQAILASLVESGDLERDTRLLIERLLVPGDVFVDVGANLGIHTLAAGRAMRGQGRIIAFEPFETTCRLLEKSVWINGLSEITHIDRRAAASRAGRQKLFLGQTSGHNSLFPLAGGSGPGGTIYVDTVRLDAALDPALRVTLIKIDVEGAELDVLAGAAMLVRNNPDIALIVEFGPSHLKRSGHSSAGWLAAFAGFGLEYQAIDDVTGALAARTPAQLEAATSTNLLFARAGAPVWTRAGGHT